MILAGIPWSLTISLTKIWAMSTAEAVVRVGIKWATLVSLSTTTKIESKFPKTFGNPVVKSMLMHSQFISGTSKGYNFPGILTLSALTFWKIRHCLVNSKAFFFILGLFSTPSLRADTPGPAHVIMPPALIDVLEEVQAKDVNKKVKVCIVTMEIWFSSPGGIGTAYTGISPLL